MCGLLAYLSTDADRVDDGTVDGGAATRCTACTTAAPTTRRSGRTPAPCSASTGCRSSTSSGSPQPLPYADGRYRIVFNGEIYNYLELREELAAAGADLRHRRATPRRSSPATTCGARTSSRGCAACSPSSSGTRQTGRRSAPATRSASSRCSPRGWPTAGSSSARRRRRCSSCSAAARRAGGVDPASLQHYLTLQYVPEPATLHRGIRRIESGTSFTVADGELHTTRYFHPTFTAAAGAAGQRAGALRPDRRRRSTSRWPSTCAPTSPWGRSCPAASTPPRSRRWPSATTPTC